MEQIPIQEHLQSEIDKGTAALKQFRAFVRDYNSDNLLTCLWHNFMMVSEGLIDDNLTGKHPAMLELAARECLSGSIGGETYINPTVSSHSYELLEAILSGELSQIQLDRLVESSTKPEILGRLEGNTKLVRGDSFPEQISGHLRDIQGKYDAWFESKAGISPSRVVQIVSEAMEKTEAVLHSLQEEAHHEGLVDRDALQQLIDKAERTEEEQGIVEMFPQGVNSAYVHGCVRYLNEHLPTILPVDLSGLPLNLSKGEIRSFKKLIGVDRDTLSTVNDMQRHPVYVLATGKVLLSEPSNLLHVAFDRFEEIAKSDSIFNDRTYSKFRGEWLEDRTFNHLAKIFPESCIYKTLDYPNPDRETGTTELDLAVLWEPFVLLVEAKSGQFRFEAVSGNKMKLKRDLTKNVSEAFDQSQRAIRYINENDNPVFTERGTGRQLKVDKSVCDKLIPISISLRHLAGLATALDELKQIGLFTDGLYPYSVSEADLELITYLGLKPDYFIHYIIRRISLLNDNIRWMGDEIDLALAYQDGRLLLENIGVNENKPDFQDGVPTTIALTGYSDKMTEFMAYKRGDIAECPQFSMQFGDGVEGLLDNLAELNSLQSRKAIHSLLGLQHDQLLQIAMGVQKISDTVIVAGKNMMMSAEYNDTYYCLLGFGHLDIPVITERLNYRCRLEKYRRKKRVCVGLGVYGSGTDPTKLQVAVVEYIQSDWYSEPDLEEELQREIPTLPAVLPGRNKPCFCGSGKKYKKCCLLKVEELKMV